MLRGVLLWLRHMQVICSNLIDFIMLGLVFARFSAPFKRATSIRFSTMCTINRHSSGYWALTFRYAGTVTGAWVTEAHAAGWQRMQTLLLGIVVCLRLGDIHCEAGVLEITLTRSTGALHSTQRLI